MYVPPHFAVDDPDLIRAAMAAHPLATLVTCGPGGLMANHVPLMFVPQTAPDDARASRGMLHGHVSLANPQWREIASGTEILAIFNGPDAYISPSVYATKRETGKVVPTWNYVAVHAYGIGRTYDDPARLHALVSQLTDVHERDRDEPWHVEDAPDSYIAGQLRGIVGIEIAVARVVGKWKISQNRSEGDRRGAISDLSDSSDSNARTLAHEMATREIT